MILAICGIAILAIGGILVSYRMGYRDGYKQALTALNQEGCEFSEFGDGDPNSIDDKWGPRFSGEED